MKKFIIISTLIIVALSASQLFAGKDIANHVVVGDAATVQSKVDDLGNLFVLSPTYSNGVVLTATFKAVNKKGKEYASGNLPELVGANWVGFAGWISFSKNVVILAATTTTETKWYSYKLSKKGATKLGEMTVTADADTFQQLLLWRNKVIVQTQSGGWGWNDIKTNKYEQYNIKLQKMKKTMEGISQNAGAVGKAFLFTTVTGVPPNQVTIYKLQKPGK